MTVFAGTPYTPLPSATVLAGFITLAKHECSSCPRNQTTARNCSRAEVLSVLTQLLASPLLLGFDPCFWNNVSGNAGVPWLYQGMYLFSHISESGRVWYLHTEHPRRKSLAGPVHRSHVDSSATGWSYPELWRASWMDNAELDGLTGLIQKKAGWHDVDWATS